MTNRTRDPNQGIGLAARVIAHLSGLPNLGPNDVASLDYTQKGMVVALDVRQSSLAKVLFSLTASEVVTFERRFVGDANRRMKVFSLTSLGRTAAGDLQSVLGAPSPPHSPPK
jgi:hypothetical protein